jgi:beta-glucosidase
VNLPAKTFEFFNRDAGSVKVTPGDYELLYGTSSDSKDLKTLKITIKKA